MRFRVRCGGRTGAVVMRLTAPSAWNPMSTAPRAWNRVSTTPSDWGRAAVRSGLRRVPASVRRPAVHRGPTQLCAWHPFDRRSGPQVRRDGRNRAPSYLRGTRRYDVPVRRARRCRGRPRVRGSAPRVSRGAASSGPSYRSAPFFFSSRSSSSVGRFSGAIRRRRSPRRHKSNPPDRYPIAGARIPTAQPAARCRRPKESKRFRATPGSRRSHNRPGTRIVRGPGGSFC